MKKGTCGRVEERCEAEEPRRSCGMDFHICSSASGKPNKPGTECHLICLSHPLSTTRTVLIRQKSPRMTSDLIDPYVFISEAPPSDPRFFPPLANGLLGWRVFDSRMHMGGVYNGVGGDCHRADVPCPLSVQMKMTDAGQNTYKLDMHSGVFSHTIVTGLVEASQVFYAHRLHPNLLVMEILLKRVVTTAEPVTVQLESSFRPQSDDIAFQSRPDYKEARCISGWAGSSEVPGGARAEVHLIWTPIPSALTLPPDQSGSSWLFLAAVGGSREKVEWCFDVALELVHTDELRSSHVTRWAEIWMDSGVEVVGDDALNRAVIGCVFYLLSSFLFSSDPDQTFGGVSPGGLSNGSRDEDYHGHVFWDQDVWMFPSVALFYPKLAKSVLEYRVRTVEGARANAQKMGFKGLKFAWESAVSGQEVCPEEVYAQQEVHINGAVVLAFQQYFYLTRDLEMFRGGRGSEVVGGVADYWVSRVTWDAVEQQYHLKGVMPPDEYHSDVHDSAFTNAAARRSLQFAVELAALLAQAPPPEWQEVADKLVMPFDSALHYHPEFDGYTRGSDVKQADVVLLGFPLDLPMTPEVRRNDLEAYEPVTDPLGPAMTWGMFAVGWLELGEAEKAQELLHRCFQNIQEPFQVWSESSDGFGCVNFLTGMGGFLQAALFGYTGFRVHRHALGFSPALPREVRELRLRGVSYLGNKMEVLVTHQDVSVSVREAAGDAEAWPLEAVLSRGDVVPLTPGHTHTFPRQPGQIRPQSSGSFCSAL